MRIAFLGPSYPWRGGIAQFAQNFAEKLAKNDNEIMMFTFINQYPPIIFPGGNQFEQGKKNFNMPTHRILTPYNPITWFSAIHDINGWDPDILIVSYWLPVFAPAYGFVLRHLKKCKIVFLIHNLDFHEKWPMADKLSKYALKPADYFLTLSTISTDKLKLLRFNRDNQIIQLFHPVYEYINTQDQAIKDYKRILFFGFIKHYKGLDILLEAMPKVIKEIPQIKLVIAGEVYGDNSLYIELIKKLNLVNNIESHFSYISDEQIEEYFLRSDVCVLPYRSATQSGVTQMSFAYEVPVIATRVGGIEETVKDYINGLLVEPNNPDTLADKIIEYYNSNIADKFHANIRKQNENFSWDTFTKRFLEITN